MDMKQNIFISSTYVDLQEHRKEVWQLLEKYDVNVLGMEKFGARKDTPLNTCIKEVSRTDIYVGVILHRLGSIETNTKKSYTQLEYEKAIELNKEILIYLIDETNSVVNTQFIDFGEKHEQLENFKQLLKEKHTVDFFRNPSDLVERLENRLDDLLVKNKKELAQDTEQYSKEILEKFHLFPNKYNGREIRLKIKISKQAFPLSKRACDAFGVNFGETVAIPITLISPVVESDIEYIIVSEDLSDFYFKLEETQEIYVLGRLIFSEERVGVLKAIFFDKKKTERKINPHYNPEKPDFSYGVSSMLMEQFNNPKFITETTLIEGEGMAILGFIKEY